MAPIRKLTSLDFGVLFVGLWLLSKAIGILLRRSNATRLKGPPSESWLFGFSSFMSIGDPSLAYEKWTEQYGAVFRVPITLYVSITSRLGMGQTKIVVCDPKAIQHIYSKTTFGYIYTKSRKKELTAIVNSFSQTCRMKWLTSTTGRRGYPVGGRRTPQKVDVCPLAAGIICTNIFPDNGRP